LNNISQAIIPLDQVGKYIDYPNFETANIPVPVAALAADEDYEPEDTEYCQLDNDILTNGDFKKDKKQLFKSKK
jgi:hypothetical protein